MTRTDLRIAALLVAGAAALATAGLFGVSPWWGLPLIPAVWLGLVASGGAIHGWMVRRALERDRRRGTVSVAALASDAAWRLRRVAAGEAGFTAGTGEVPDLERAVFFPASPGDESCVLMDVAAASKKSRLAIVAGLRVLHHECVAALGRPLHPLFLDAETLLPLLGRPLPRLFRRWRVRRAWAREQHLFVPERAGECIAIRLIQSGMPRAALHVLARGPRTRRRRVLRRFARLLVVHRQNVDGDIGFRLDTLGVWAPAVVLVMGRRLTTHLVPGTPLVQAPKRGPAALEAAVRNMPRLVRELADLARDLPSLEGAVTGLLATMLDRPADGVLRDIRSRVIDARADAVLVPHLRGLALLREGRPAEAAFEFETALERSGDYTEAAFSLAVARRRAGDPKRGAAALREHQIMNPRNPDVPVYLARYLADGGDRPAARGVYRDGITRFPEALRIRVAYALDLAAWGDETAAADQLDVARKARPGDPHLALLAGRARLHAGRHQDAIEALDQASRQLRAGDRSEAQYLLVSAFRSQGRHEMAKPIADELVEALGRGQESMLDEVAEYLEERHDYRGARRASLRARRLRGGGW